MINMVKSKPDGGELAFGTFVPTVPAGSIPSALGLVGAVIMPHNLYLHSALVLTRSVGMKNYDQVREAIIYNNIESGFSLFVSFIISTTVIATFAVYIINF
jgi:natural resistance-associated macrophage protein